MKIINLLPQSELKELSLQLAANKLLKFFAFVFISLLCVFMVALATRFYIEGTIDQSKSDVVHLQQQLSDQKNQDLEKKVQALNTEIRNVKLINDQHYQWSLALIELGNITPNGVHMDSVNFDRATGRVDVRGYADRRDDVIQFWSNVTKSSYFGGINFPLNNLEQATNTLFTFSFLIKPGMIQNKK